MTARKTSTVVRVLGYQVLIILVVVAGFALKGNEQQTGSALLGGAAAFIPNLFFSLWVNRTTGQGAKKVMNAFYVGESGKFFLTVAAFILIFQLPNIHILPLLVCYVAALSVFWFALLMR